jgi:hypothetical protein
LESEHPREFVSHWCTIKKMRETYNYEISDHVKGIWIFGASGSGKSSGVRQAVDRGNLYEKLLNKWWDNYTEQPVILLDDVGPTHKHLGEFLKRWADHYPFRAEYKGGSRMINPEWVIVTSQYRIGDIFGDDAQLVAALLRRFEYVEL